MPEIDSVIGRTPEDRLGRHRTQSPIRVRPEGKAEFALRKFFLISAYYSHVEKRERANQNAEIQEIIRKNQKRLAESRRAIGSMDAHLQQNDQSGDKNQGSGKD